MAKSAFARYPRSSRFGGIPLIGSIVLALVAALVVTLAVFGSPASSDSAPERTTAASPSSESGAAVAPLCGADGVRCGSVTIDSLGPVTYAIVTSGDDHDGLVLDEPGGPGADLFGRPDASFISAVPGTGGHDLLLIRDRWAASATTPACSKAVADTFRSAAAAHRFLGPARSCPLLGWTSRSYAAAVRAILAAEHRTLTGAIGESYGALLAYAAVTAEPSAWLIINAPAAPGAATGQTVISDRLTALDAALDRSYQGVCRKRGADCAARGSVIARDAARRLAAPVQISGRSQAITAADVALAVLSASYNLDQNGEWLWRVLTALPHLSDQDYLQIGRFADQVLQRYGSGDISVSLGGYVAGLCLGYRGWSAGVDAEVTSPGWLLQRVSATCEETSIPSSAGFDGPKPLPGSRVCVFGNDLDPVSPASWAATWASSLGVKPIRYSVQAHVGLASLTVAQQCDVLTTKDNA